MVVPLTKGIQGLTGKMNGIVDFLRLPVGFLGVGQQTVGFHKATAGKGSADIPDGGNNGGADGDVVVFPVLDEITGDEGQRCDAEGIPDGV